MDKSIRSFLAFSAPLILLFISVVAAFAYVYRYFTLDTYNGILLILIMLSIIITVLVIFVLLAILHAYRKKSVSLALLLPVRMGLKIIMPFTIFVTGLFKGNKDAIRGLFIDINNIIVQSGKRRYKPGQILVLLPHCLQNSECGHKITNDIDNCRRCGKCSIGSILTLVREEGIRAVVVTGGTAARNIVSREKPRMLLSVACERDLAIGIADVSSIPVIGVVNERPNGPCFNTTVNVDLLKEKLREILNGG